MRTLAVIPARGGSKGIPRKNIRLLAGKPLIAHTIDAARAASSLDRVIVSTDDPEIATVAREWGADVPFIRPAELATDTAAMLPVVLHAFRWLEQAVGTCDVVVLLQPTSPFRPPTMIDDAIAMIEEQSYDAALTVSPVKTHPYWMKSIVDGCVRPFIHGAAIPTRRQDLPVAYAISGSLYAWTRGALLKRAQGELSGATQFPDERVGAILVDGAYALDLDSEFDFKIAEVIARESGSGKQES